MANVSDVNLPDYFPSECEACGAPAEAELPDGSKWCRHCHRLVMRLGYGAGVDPPVDCPGSYA